MLLLQEKIQLFHHMRIEYVKYFRTQMIISQSKMFQLSRPRVIHQQEEIIIFSILNEALWMPRLDHSLINLNKLRHNGVEVQDNPFSNAPMAITSKMDGFTTFLESTETTIFLKTWTPYQKDLELHPHIQLSSPEPWDPQNIVFLSYSLSERSRIESRSISAIYKNISIGNNNHEDNKTL